MGEPRFLQADLDFRAGGHSVRLTLARSALEVEVEAHLTADTWRGEFDATFIEDLTHKTGNFKQFGIFCSMLESALMRSSECVSLELLTYSDLETLRSRKMGGGISRPPPSAASPLSAKRYLILVYCVEFDRIHYPLPLPYAGRPDPAALRRLVWELREELARLRSRRGDDRRDAEIRRLRDELQQALEEKRAAEAALRREPVAALRRLEEKLQREKARHQREHRQLAAELAEAKAAERRLQLQVKSLTAELASCKRGTRTPTGTAPRPPERQRSASRESRSSSQGRPPPRSPSPAGPQWPRFDPTAFVRDRQRRQKEAELKNQRRRTASCSASPARSHRRSSSAETRSRRSVLSSGSETEDCSDSLPPRRVTRTRRPLSTSSCNGPSAVPRHRKPPPGSTVTERPGKENRSQELADIDARLQALQEYMAGLAART